MNGRPGYFDITIRNTLQPLYIPRVAETSGIVAEAAEMDKDDRHDARVTYAGEVFYPLVVETLGLWSPDSRGVAQGFPEGFPNLTSLISVVNMIIA